MFYVLDIYLYNFPSYLFSIFVVSSLWDQKGTYGLVGSSG